jgi:hypothetical protein
LKLNKSNIIIVITKIILFVAILNLISIFFISWIDFQNISIPWFNN